MIQRHRGISFLPRRQETNRFPPLGKLFVFAGNPLGSEGTKQLPSRGGVSTYFRCEAPFLLRREIECRITPSLPAQKALTPPLLQASLQAPLHHYSDLYERAMWRQPVWPVASSESPGNHGRSEERRVGKECRSRWSPDHEK